MNNQRTIFLALFVHVVILLISSTPLTAAILINPNGTGATDVDPADPTTWDSSTHVYVGEDRSGELLVDGASVLETYRVYLGDESGSIGIVTVTGTGSTWISDYLTVGNGGSGTLSITDDGVVCNSYCMIGSLSGSEGMVKVDGNGSTWNSGRLDIGGLSNGELHVTNGGTVSSGSSRLGLYENGSGMVTIDGDGSTWTDSFFVNIGGNGTLAITNGGAVHCNWSVIGYSEFDASSDGTGVVTVDGIGSTLTNSGTLFVGDDDGYISDTTTKGELKISNGGTVSNQDAYIVYSNGSPSTVTVDGAGSTWINNNLHANGTLSITNGGTVISADSYINNTVTVDGAGSTWTNNNLQTNGTLSITNGGTVISADADIGDGNISGTVTVDGAGSTWTNNSLHVDDTLSITNGGTVISAYSYISYFARRTVTVDGAGSTWTNDDLYIDTIGVSGVVDITGGGLVSVAKRLHIRYGNFVNMSTGGMLALYGEADGSLADFLRLVGAFDPINYWDDSIADWASITEATLGTDYTLEYLTEGELAGYTLLTVGTVPIPGDANGDGLVDGADVTILAGNWQFGVDDGQTATRAMGDFNGDGLVDGSDVTILASNWQYGVETAVPEPGCVVLLLMSFVTGLALLLRKQSL